MLKDTTKLLTKLRGLMRRPDLVARESCLEAYIIPSSDAHGSEYLRDTDQRRAFITGFTGSSGTALVTAQKALLWTDGRYYLQASQQLDANWELMRDGQTDTPTIGEWLIKNIPASSCVGIDSSLYEENLFQTLAAKLRETNCELVDTKENLIDMVWQELEARTTETKRLIQLDLAFTGQTVNTKLNLIREHMRGINVDSMVVTSLDDIAWLLNMRGNDIPYGAVFFAYCIISYDMCQLFTDLNRLDEGEASYLSSQDNFEFIEYEQFFSEFKVFIQRRFVAVKNKNKIFLSSSSSHAIHSLVPAEYVHKDVSYLTKLRGIKNTNEIEAARQVHIRDSALLVEFFYKLQTHFSGRANHFDFEMNEFNVAKCLDNMRISSAGCLCPSFETICSSGANGAIIHYKPEQDTCSQVERNNILLLDSGGHYLNMGTTDVTRTVFLGESEKISVYQKECFTRVLKGHIQLSMRIFPSGTKPELLDSFARQALWQAGLDYRHGTGHGVGALLNVHELPIIANRRSVDIGIQENMIITIEPGYYETGKFGIRIENCNLTVRARTPYVYADNVEFITFEPLTLVPIQREFIDKQLLNQEELDWLNQYHNKCAHEVGSVLKKANKLEVYAWLLEQTQPL